MIALQNDPGVRRGGRNVLTPPPGSAKKAARRLSRRGGRSPGRLPTSAAVFRRPRPPGGRPGLDVPARGAPPASPSDREGGRSSCATDTPSKRTFLSWPPGKINPFRLLLQVASLGQVAAR